VNSYVFLSFTLIGELKNTTVSSGCRRKSARILSDTNFQHSTPTLKSNYILKAVGLILAQAAVLRININIGGPLKPHRYCPAATAAHMSHTNRSLLASSPPPYLP